MALWTSTEALLARERPYEARRLQARELRVELAFAGAIAALAVAGMIVLPSDRPDRWLDAALLTALYAVCARARIYIGAGSGVPTQLALVPMLALLPVGHVAVAVAAALVLAELPDVLSRRAAPERIAIAVADAGYAIGPALLILAAGEPTATLANAGLWGGVLIAQVLTDVALSTAREALGRGIAPGLQLGVLLPVAAIDLLLTPVAAIAAIVSSPDEPIYLVGLPLALLLAGIAADRRRRIAAMLARADELERARARLAGAVRRIGEAFSSTLDSAAVAGVALDAAADALEADAGKVVIGREHVERGAVDAWAPVLAAAAAAAAAGDEAASVANDSQWALACPIRSAEGGVIVLGRSDAPFEPDERDLLAYLAAHASTSIENARLHDAVRRQAVTDGLTGLANQRRLQQALGDEVSRARRYPSTLSLVLLDIDDFKQINDRYGHPAGDAVLRCVAKTLRATIRATDLAARHGGEEFALVLPHTGLDAAQMLAEVVRRAIATRKIELPGGEEVSISVSLGVAAFPDHAPDAWALVAAADAALYEAKRTGKDKVAAAGPIQIQSAG